MRDEATQRLADMDDGMPLKTGPFEPNPFLEMDYYKGCHYIMLPEGISKSVSYCIPRSSRIPNLNECVFFGLQRAINRINYAFEHANTNALTEYVRVMSNTFGESNFTAEPLIALQKLGYLPIEVRALPEGTRVPMGVPMFSITNTRREFAWLPQFLESWISAEMWHPIVVATVADMYKQVVKRAYAMSCKDKDPSMALGLFSFRGEESPESATASGDAWATAFRPCATVPTAMDLFLNYNTPLNEGIVGSPSTEHAVMCSNFAVDGDEETLLRRLLREIYPNSSFSAVLDAYDYWNVVDNILPKLKNDILAHRGCFLVRGDSGDPVEVVTKTVQKLWDIFGGTVNEQGYKVLDQHVKAIYGDGITYDRCAQIMQWLVDHGFAACNVSLGVGSFSTQALQYGGEMYPFTRDTFNIAIKATYIEVYDRPYKIYKAPKVNGAHGETTDYFKRSPKGLVVVHKTPEGLVEKHGMTYEEMLNDPDNLLQPVFRNGSWIKMDSLRDIRKRLE